MIRHRQTFAVGHGNDQSGRITLGKRFLLDARITVEHIRAGREYLVQNIIYLYETLSL